jgi:hypothetical protein
MNDVPMNSEWARKLLDLLVENSLRILRAGFGVNSVESVFFDIIGLLRSHPTLKPYYLERVRATLMLPDPGLLDAGMLPRELIELSAHELQWDELRHLANERIQRVFGNDSALAVGDIAQTVLGAFRSDWPDREFYRHYSS